MLVAQLLTTAWTKASRGAPASARRSATPDAAPLPAAIGDGDGPVLVHGVVFDEADGFEVAAGSWEPAAPPGNPWPYRPERGWRFAALPVTVGGCELALVDDQLTVERLPAQSWEHPRRMQAVVLRLALGSWGQVIHNRRFSMEDGWCYERRVLNVAHGLPVDPDLFVRSMPRRRVDESAGLA